MSAQRGRGGAALIAVLFSMLTVCGTSGSDGDVGVPEPPPEPAQGGVPWPAPADALTRAVDAGLEPATHEFLEYHLHAHLDVFLNGEPVEVPAAVGINIDDPAVHPFEDPGGTSYGGIDPPCEQPCISPLHTHSPDGVLHTESADRTPNTLGQFFIEWDVALDEQCVGGYCEPDVAIQVYLDGDPYSGDPTQIELTDRLEIAIVIGTPPAEIPAAFPIGA